MDRKARNRRWTIVGTAALGVLAALPVVAARLGTPAQAAVAVPGDGTTSATAGASCWGIKQQYPASKDGIYWLSNSSMERPASFRCDMTTEGGGWVLIARGRQGWNFDTVGQGSPVTLRTTPDGPAAFAPAALDTQTIAGLLGSTNLATAPDGIRLRRAVNATGTLRQEVRLFPKRPDWSWALDAGQPLAKIVINGVTYAGGNTYDTSANKVFGQTVNGLGGISDSRRIWTFPHLGKNFQQGFGTGLTVKGGSASATNYLYSYRGETSPIAFTQVWLRPRITNSAAGFTALPAAGLPAASLPAGLKRRSELAPWGVVGADHTGETSASPWYANVLAIRAVGDRVYVGGRFTGVRQGPTGAVVSRPFLAAFDLNGNWISTFKPAFNGRVWAIDVSPTGKLLVGGDFTKVNGVARSGLVALNPLTGATDPTFTASVSRTDGQPIVRALAVKGNSVYVSGRFNRARGGSVTAATVSSAVNFDATTGQPGTWKPVIHASAVDLAFSTDQRRVLMTGYFASINGDTNMGYFGVTDATTGAVVPGLGPLRPSVGSIATFQLAAAESPRGRLIVGGSEHSLQLYDATRKTLIDSHITKIGGDFQVAEVQGGALYAGCHCLNWDYQGTNNWTSPSGFRSVDPIRFLGRYDPETLEMDTSWFPNGLKGAADDGPWSLSTDKRGCLWFGGDFVRGSYSGNAATDYLGGFGRFCPLDTSPPTTPATLKATRAASTVTLTWGASTDASGSVAYDIYRDDRVIATTYGTTFTDALPPTGVTRRYTVRAADARGNRSAAPAPLAVGGPAPVASTPVPWASTWRYRDTGADPGAAWTAPTTVDTAWASGKAPLGWGAAQATTIGATRPAATYYRKTFTLTSTSTLKLATVDLKMSQGAVVYLNGVEIGRTNMPAGKITPATTASIWIGGADNDRVRSFSAPASLLRTGTNVVAVEVHGWRAQSGVSVMDASLRLVGTSTADTVAPTAPTARVTKETGGLRVAWTASTDNRGLGGYLITRDGAPVAAVPPSAINVLDPTTTTVAHTYVVTAFDTAGNVKASPAVVWRPTTTTPTTSPTTTTTTRPPATTTTSTAPGTTVRGTEVVVADYGRSWRWTYPASAPAAAWPQSTFADQAWATGTAPFGFGDPSRTVISTAAAPRPLTSYYRSTVTVSDPASFQAMYVDLIRNAGAVVYVNGVEVGRSNLPAGPIDANTFALTTPTKAERTTPTRLAVPTSAFRAGVNTIAVELHLGWRSAPTAGFDLRVVGIHR